MMRYKYRRKIKQRCKSRTHLWTTFVGLVSLLEVNFGLFREYIGEHYNVWFVAVMAVSYILREATKEAIEEK